MSWEGYTGRRVGAAVDFANSLNDFKEYIELQTLTFDKLQTF